MKILSTSGRTRPAVDDARTMCIAGTRASIVFAA